MRRSKLPSAENAAATHASADVGGERWYSSTRSEPPKRLRAIERERSPRDATCGSPESDTSTGKDDVWTSRTRDSMSSIPSPSSRRGSNRPRSASSSEDVHRLARPALGAVTLASRDEGPSSPRARPARRWDGRARSDATGSPARRRQAPGEHLSTRSPGQMTGGSDPPLPCASPPQPRRDGG